MQKVFISAIIIALAYSCKKKVEPPKTPENFTPAVDSIMLKLTAHQWEIYDVKTSGTSVWNFPGVIQKCLKDDSYRFYKDSLLVSYENTLKCGTDDSTTSDWQFIDGRKKVKATILNLTDTADIISLSNDKMQLALEYNGSPAEIYFRKR